MKRVRFAGVGSFVPRRVISNERIAKAIPGWPAERIEEKIGIHERRWLWDFDAETGRSIPPPDDAEYYPANNVEMCEVALRRAMEMARVDGPELDAILVVTCTPDRLNFNHDAMALHEKFGCRTDTFALMIDDGCGGTPYVIDMARRMLEGGTFRTIGIVASAFTSALINREEYTAAVKAGDRETLLNAYLSMYVFGDGASAVVLRAEDAAHADGAGAGGAAWDHADEAPGILRSMSGNAHAELVVRRAGGVLGLAYQGRTQPGDHAFVIDGTKVARSYPVYMRECIESVTGRDPELLARVKRFYFHQPNKRVMDRFVADMELAPEKVACHVDRYGNTSAAGMMTLLAEDLEEGRVALGSGDLIVVAAVGANVHYGAQLVRL